MTRAELKAKLENRIRRELEKLPCFKRRHHYLDDCPFCGALYAVPLAAHFPKLRNRCYECGREVIGRLPRPLMLRKLIVRRKGA